MDSRTESLPRSLVSAFQKRSPRSVHFRDEHLCTKIASYNIHKCVGTDRRFDPDRIASVVAELDADIVALQEVDERTGDRQGLLDLKALERATGLIPLWVQPTVRSHGWHGNLLLARSRIVQEIRPLNLPGLEPRGALIADLTINGVSLRIIAAHFGLLRRSRSRQASVLLEAAHSAIQPTVLLGDLNEWRVKSRSSLSNLLPHFGPVHAPLPSFPSRFPLLALDRIMAKPASLISSIEIHQTPLSRVASDHLPVKACLNIAPVHDSA